MNLELSDEALEYGRTARAALAAAGGDRLVQVAEQQSGYADGAIDRVLEELGAWDLDPRGSDDEIEAAAALCRSAGYWSVPYPVAERLSGPALPGVDGLVVVTDVRPRARVGGLDLRWAAVTLDGRRYLATPQPPTRAPRYSSFVVDLTLEPLDDDGVGDVALALALPVWTLLGMLDRAIDLTRDYVVGRQQFGASLASFQGVQFQLTDAEVERSGLEELAKYAVWSIRSRGSEALRDALALRLAAIEAADTVFRVAHQLHGAIGFCDETALSWLSRYSHPLRRLPLNLSGTLAALTAHAGRTGLSGLFDAVAT